VVVPSIADSLSEVSALPLSGVDALNPAFEHTKAQLFRPFSFSQWTRLAFVGLLAGEMSSGGGCNFSVPAHRSDGQHHLLSAPQDWTFLVPLIIVAIIAVPILWLAFLYISSRMRFVLFDSVVAKNCEIGRMWRERRGPALQLFVWQIVFSLITLAGLALLVGVPALVAFLLGWFTEPRAHLAPLILSGIALFFVLMAWFLGIVTVHVFTKDFVVPQMALENVSAFEGWRRLWAMIMAEKGGYAAYAGMKLVMAIGAAFAVAMVAIVVIIVLLIPFGGLGAITILAGRAAGMGLSWNVFTITAAIVFGTIFFLVLFYALALVSVPVIVFFPAYSIYFFAARYSQLGSVIYPPPPPLPPPSIVPAPEPIG
jgi:hypothetical protein